MVGNKTAEGRAKAALSEVMGRERKALFPNPGKDKWETEGSAKKKN